MVAEGTGDQAQEGPAADDPLHGCEAHDPAVPGALYDAAHEHGARTDRHVRIAEHGERVAAPGNAVLVGAVLAGDDGRDAVRGHGLFAGHERAAPGDVAGVVAVSHERVVAAGSAGQAAEAADLQRVAGDPRAMLIGLRNLFDETVEDGNIGGAPGCTRFRAVEAPPLAAAPLLSVR